MSRTLAGTLALALFLALAALGLVRPASAQNADVCFAVADHTVGGSTADALVTLDRVSGVTTLVGYPGTTTIEAIALEPGGSGPLYAANGGQLGTLSLTDGSFTPKPQPFGTGGGAAGEIAFTDVDGLTIDLGTGIFYGAHRRAGTPKDLLFQIDRVTGAHVPDAFGPGVDYVVVDGPGVLDDVDDIAVSPTTGVMFATSNNSGVGGVLAIVNKATGAATVVGEFGVDDIEGLAYFNDGQLYGSTGKDAPTTTRNRLYRVDETSGATTLVAPFSQFSDYEALDCLTGPTAVTLSHFSAAPTGRLPLGSALLGMAAAGLLTLFVLWRRASA